MKRKRKIYFSKIHLNKEYFNEYEYSYSQIKDSEIYKWVYNKLSKNNELSLLSKIYCTDNMFEECFIELKCDKILFYDFCNQFVSFFNKYIDNIRF